MTLALDESLYSRMVGVPFSSRAKVSMRPARRSPVEYSLPRKRRPNTVSRLASRSLWISHSSFGATRAREDTLFPWMRKRSNHHPHFMRHKREKTNSCLLYTSDAADE